MSAAPQASHIWGCPDVGRGTGARWAPTPVMSEGAAEVIPNTLFPPLQSSLVLGFPTQSWIFCFLFCLGAHPALLWGYSSSALRKQT